MKGGFLILIMVLAALFLYNKYGKKLNTSTTEQKFGLTEGD